MYISDLREISYNEIKQINMTASLKKYLYLIIIISIITVLNNSCKKDTVDYRDKYCGEWNFVTNYYYYTISDDVFDTTYNYQGHVWYDSTGQINIEFRENYILNAKVGLRGEITDKIFYDNTKGNGEFINHDSLFVDLRINGNMYGITQFIHGNKIE
jgi:hypothetical protein